MPLLRSKISVKALKNNTGITDIHILYIGMK